MTPDARFVVFASNATNLIGSDTNEKQDIYIRDRTAGTMRRVSVTDAEVQSDNHSSAPAISETGRFVVFESDAGLIPNDTNFRKDIYIRDRTDGTTRRVSVTDGELQANGDSFDPAISADGRFVVFASNATNLIGSDTNEKQDIYIRDRTSGTTRRVSVTDAETQSDNNSSAPAISETGRFVAFASDAGLIPNDTNSRRDIYIRDRTSGTTRRVSVTSSERQAGNDSDFPAISATGRFVVFESDAGFFNDDTNFLEDIYIRDRELGTTARVSLTDNELQPNFGSFAPAISTDGRFVAFESNATNLVAGDGNLRRDIFVRDRGAFGARTRVRLSLARKRIPAKGPLRVRVRNRNGFPVHVKLSAKTTRRVAVGGRKRRVRTKAKLFTVEGKSRKTVKLRLPKALRRLLKQNGRLSLRLAAKVTGPAGNTRTVKKKATPRLKRPPQA